MARSITAKDVVQVQGRYLVVDDNERFFLKGIAFPDSPLQPRRHETDYYHVQYNATGWISVLRQLRGAMPEAALNTLRLYRLDADEDYSEFFEAAAELGFYLLVPLTANAGAVLNRLAHPPKCYPRELWNYGRTMVQMSLKHPNVVAGVLGNEVMNSLESWHAAPCIKAYARDLKLYMKSLQTKIQSNQALSMIYANRTGTDGKLPALPLMYAAQDSGIGAALSNIDVTRITVDYLSCSPSSPEEVNDSDDDFGIDILGVNVESWCATRDTFQHNDDGTLGTFYQLWTGLHANVKVPLVFSELGCSHSFFNRDTPELRTPEGTRDWTEVPVVLQDMQDTWSGFCAYAYWGNPLFNMMTGGPWNGRDVLEPTQDFLNFQQQCLSVSLEGTISTTNSDAIVDAGSLHALPMQNGGIMEQYYQMLEESNDAPTCTQVEDVLFKTAALELASLYDMKSYFADGGLMGWHLIWICLITLAAAFAIYKGRRYFNSRRGLYEKIPNGNIEATG